MYNLQPLTLPAQPPCAMTSTYLPPFFFFALGPLRACGAPSKSSMLLAVLIPVPGLEGGPDANGGLASAGGLAGPSLSDGTPGVLARDPGPPIGGGIDELRGGIEVGGRRPVGGPAGWFGPPDALRAVAGGPLGGGGVAAGFDASDGPAFLLIHFLSSGS